MFFDLLGDRAVVRGDEKKVTNIPKATVLTCEDCGLCDHARSPKLRFSGEGRMKILLVGEQPSREEDQHGEYGYGKEYQFLKNILSEWGNDIDWGYDIDKDFYYTTAINCAPTKTREPKHNEVLACSSRLIRLIEKLGVVSVILLGDHAAQSLIQSRLRGRIQGLSVSDFVGDHIPDQEYKVWLSPVWGIRDLLEVQSYEDGTESKPKWERDIAYFKMWKQHLASAIDLRQFYEADYKDQCIVIDSEVEAVRVLRDALEWQKIAFDYETTGLKPHREGHHIRSVAISDGLYAYSFEFYNTKEFQKAWKDLMLSDVKKIAQNLPYEMIWTYVQCGYWVKNWHWDTMLAQHCISNQKPTGLKYMVYRDFGITGYDDEADAYLKPVKTEKDRYGANAINRIDAAPLPELLLYNALDALYTFKLAQTQKGDLSEKQMEGYLFFLESEQTLTKITENGFNLDEKKHREVSLELDLLMETQEKLIRSDDVLKQWTDGEFNFQSSPQLGKLLYEILGIDPPARTATGQPSVDEDALSKIDLPIVNNIVHYRKLAKLKKTYMGQYQTESWKGKIRPNFHLHRVDTFRSGSNGPNIQNQPKRNKEYMRMVRSSIVPSPGNRIVELDYKSLEVCINAVYSQDPMLLKYINDPTTDMHRDSAADCFLLKPEEVTKPIRNDVKGEFVFAEFYGSYYKQVAVDLWESAHQHNLRDHLADKGIKCFQDFERHIQEAERILWEERFPVHNEWREKQWKFYQKKGYVELLTGFRCYGPMKRNNTFNSPGQGSGFHVLMWTLNQINPKIQRLERSRIIGEIHDSCVLDMHDSEADLVDHWYWDYGTQKVREHWPWINVPLTVEKEQSEIDGSWADMKEVGPLKGE